MLCAEGGSLLGCPYLQRCHPRGPDKRRTDRELFWEEENCRSAAQRPSLRARGREQAALRMWWVRDPHVLVTHFHRSVPCLSLCPPCRHLTSSAFAPRLFKIHLGPPKKLEELDPDSIEYWRRLRKYNTWHRNKLKKGKKL